MLAIDPARFGDAEGWAQHSDAFFERLLGIEGTRLPAARRFANRAETPESGIVLPKALHEEIEALAGG